MSQVIASTTFSTTGSRDWVARLSIWLGFLVVYVVWGSTYLAIRFAVETLPPFLLMGARSVTAGALLYLWARWRGGPRLGARLWREACLQGAFLFVGCHGALAWAEQRVTSAQAALVFATMPAWMALGEWFGPQRFHPGPLLVPGLLLGIAGVAVLRHPSALLGSGEVDLSGLLALLAASLSWVVGSLRARHAPLPGGSLQQAGANLLAGGSMLLAVAFLRDESVSVGGVSPRSLLALLFLIGFGTILALTTYLYLLQRVRPTLVATYAFVNPMVAVLVGGLFGGERFDARIAISSVLLIASVALLWTDQTRRRTTS